MRRKRELIMNQSKELTFISYSFIFKVKPSSSNLSLIENLPSIHYSNNKGVLTTFADIVAEILRLPSPKISTMGDLFDQSNIHQSNVILIYENMHLIIKPSLSSHKVYPEILVGIAAALFRAFLIKHDNALDTQFVADYTNIDKAISIESLAFALAFLQRMYEQPLNFILSGPQEYAELQRLIKIYDKYFLIEE